MKINAKIEPEPLGNLEVIPGHVFQHENGSFWLGADGKYLIGLDDGYFNIVNSLYAKGLPRESWTDVTDKVALKEV